MKATFSNVSGDLTSKFSDVVWKVEYRVPLSDGQNARVMAVIDKWKRNAPEYQLFAFGGKNCSSFAAEVAKAIGLKVPSGAGSKFPIDFMAELRDLNK